VKRTDVGERPDPRVADVRYGVVGLGMVGLPLSLAAVRAGYDVIGVDVDESRVRELRDGQSYVPDVTDGEVEVGIEEGFHPTSDHGRLSTASHVAICVQSPLQKSGKPDISHLLEACDKVAPVLSDGTVVIIESTVYPGATAGIIADVFRDHGFEIGQDLYLSVSPERIDPGNTDYPLETIPKVVGGVTPKCGDQTEAFYTDVFETIVRVDGATEAEMAKLLENTYRSVNIALVNELAKVADELDVDLWNVIDAARTKPFGFHAFDPGPGLGGHCIPVDPKYLSWRAKQVGLETPVVDTADRTNREMPSYVIQRITRVLNRSGVALPDADVLVLGVAYKGDVSDTRASPAIEIISELRQQDVSVRYHDPHVPSLELNDGTDLDSVPLTSDTLESPDCVLILTNHSAFDVERIVETATRVFDTRNATEGVESPSVAKL
jgi:UDP-N-acetyl-D-glucosamine dehydrogenase